MLVADPATPATVLDRLPAKKVGCRSKNFGDAASGSAVVVRVLACSRGRRAPVAAPLPPPTVQPPARRGQRARAPRSKPDALHGVALRTRTIVPRPAPTSPRRAEPSRSPISSKPALPMYATSAPGATSANVFPSTGRKCRPRPSISICASGAHHARRRSDVSRLPKRVDVGHAALDAIAARRTSGGSSSTSAAAAGRPPPAARPPPGGPPSARRRRGRERSGSPARAGTRPRRCGRSAAARRAASESTPLSGPMKKQPPAATTTSARAPPTPGSTTATWIVPRGNSGAACASATAPAATSCGGDAVGDVDQPRVRRQRQHHPLHGSNVAVARSRSRW